MANKWRSSITEANAIFVGYSVSPSDLSSERLTRKWTGIDRTVLQAEIATLRAVKTVTDPKADNQTYSGTWTVDLVEPVLDEGGNTAGSAAIVQMLKKDVHSAATPDNMTIMRSRAYSLEQNENAWMYYERYKSEVTRRWHNILAANIEAEYAKINRIKNTKSDAINLDIYAIYYIDDPTIYAVTHSIGVPAAGTFWTPVTTSVSPWISVNVYGLPNVWTQLTDPIIREVWYEQNTDGTYNLFRSLETTSSTSIMRTRALQYAGMTLVQGAPMLDDTVLTISGFNNLTEVVYAHTRLRIGSDYYRVLSDSTAVAGQVTVDVSPGVSQATEDAADADPNQVQCYFEAL